MLGLGRWGGVFDEYSQAASEGTVVNHLFFLLPLCLLGFVGSAGGRSGPSCAAHLLGCGCVWWPVQYG